MKQGGNASRETPLAARLARLLTARGLRDDAAPALAALLELVAADHRSLTSISDPGAAVRGHVADALDGLLAPALLNARTIADLGSGAGFPGLVLAAVLPEAEVVLVDSVGKKAAFIAEAAAAMGLENAEAVHARVEAWPAGLGRFDAVTARAVAPLGVLVEYAAPLLREGGTLVAYKAQRDPAEEADGAAAAEQTGMAVEPLVVVPPRRGADVRHLHLFRKVAPTPDRFPRREGMARKRPLSAQDHARKAR